MHIHMYHIYSIQQTVNVLKGQPTLMHSQLTLIVPDPLVPVHSYLLLLCIAGITALFKV